MISEADLAVLRSHVGSEPPDEDLRLRYERTGSVERTAYEILRGRYADMLANPAKWSVDGDFTKDHTENLKALQGQLASLEPSVNPEAGAMTTSRLVRAGRSR